MSLWLWTAVKVGTEATAGTAATAGRAAGRAATDLVKYGQLDRLAN